MHNWRQYAERVIALFVIANPLAAVPFFITSTSRHNEHQKRRTARLAALTVAIVLVASIFVGEPLLNLFGISIASFRVAGGILILFTALAMMQARPGVTQQTPEEVEEASAKDEVAVVPLGIPLLAGPGAISTMIIYADQSTGWFDIVYLNVASILVAGSVWGAFSLAHPITQLLGKTGINIVIRLFGLILAAVAVEFIEGGLGELIPGLAGKG